MKKQQYELGAMELYHTIANKTDIENNPFLEVVLKDKIDSSKLYSAVAEAIKCFPLFGCTLAYKKQYFLETNDKEFKLVNIKDTNRPVEFGDNTNGFLWQICYDEYTFSLEWCHAVTDGCGALKFFIKILNNYFDVCNDEICKYSLELGYESIYDKKEKGICQNKQGGCFKASDLPYYKRGYKTDCHILKASMEQVLKVSKKYKATPTSLLIPLFSKAIKKYIKPKARNKNVVCNVLIDCRRRMGLDTMHDFIVSKNIAYIDEYDAMDIAEVAVEYRRTIEIASAKENIIKEATDKVHMIKPLASIRPRFLQKFVCKIVGKVLKHADSNFTFTYLGKLDLDREVRNGIKDFNFRSWTDFGECNVAAVDFNGTLILNICENYKNKQIIPLFIELCTEEGIEFSEVDTFEYEQANLRLTGKARL